MVNQPAATQDVGNFRHWRLEKDIDGIAWLYIDRADEKVNSLSSDVFEELDTIVDQLEQDSPAGLVLMSGKSGNFIVGADVREFDETRDVDLLRENLKKVHALLERVERLSFPKVAAFEGYCLGGGLELALCFDWRIALDADHTRIGFPETKLGIYPGYGGSGRSIAAIGGMKAMEIMLTARMLRARQARAMGLVDQTVDEHGSLRWAARRAIQKKRKHEKKGLVARLSTWGPARRFLAGQMRKKTRSKARPEHYPAPYRLIDEFEAHGDSQKAMLRGEIDNIPELLVGETSTNLRRVFRLQELLKKQGKRSDFKARRVHVIGAGTMGGDIAAWCAYKGLEVTLQDREMKYVEPALKRAAKLFGKKLKSRPQVEAAKARLRADVEGAGVKRADVVIEAIFEDRDAKRKLFENLVDDLQDHAIVATNTSAIPLDELSDVFSDPTRLVGLHFFNPVAKMPLVEVVHAEKTDSGRVDDASSFATQIGKFALPVTSTPGFLVNRVLVPYMHNAMRMHRDGVPKEALDKAAVRFGMPMGPVELVDTVGLDVGLSVIDTIMGDEAGEDRKVLEKMVDEGKLGKKSGEGFYEWEDGKPKKDDDAHKGHDLDRLAADLMRPYFEECRACLEDDVVEDADLLDAGMIFGTGFAPFRGGPMHYLDAHGMPESGDELASKPKKEMSEPIEDDRSGSDDDSGDDSGDEGSSSGKKKTSKKKKKKSGGKKSSKKKSSKKKSSKKKKKKSGSSGDDSSS
ncbi:MAG: 3-hydroxyacyl-CoA dehydrogenase NAD-binding domain-containing protein [Wenzhouxiangellaceae bacterium]|nr:3-hydroxyacyl-CoA dehydrogenase NAD-binding domain-containing protein [Wenzhouxiangellaceae bacterium]